MLLRAYTATAGIRAGVASVRAGVDAILSLDWLRLGPVDVAAPVAGAAIVWYSLDQLNRPVEGAPFWLAWFVLTAALPLAASIRFGSRALTPAVFVLAELLSLWLLFDFLYMDRVHLYDLNVYLGAAQRWADGGHAYLTAPIAAWPASPRSDYFLYPPPLLPVFALLARLPGQVVDVGFVGAMVASTFAAFRLLGLSKAWSAALLVFPPVFIGFESGNVAGLTLLLFAAAGRAGGALVVDLLFKVQAGVPVLWLLRTRRLRALMAGLAAVAVVVLVTLPLVGFGQWREWWDALGYRAQSQQLVPALYGFSDARWLPGAEYSLISAGFVLLALLFRGRRGLAALALASIFASPTLWPHGFAFALPAVLLLERDVAILAVLGMGSIGENMWMLFVIGWLAVAGAGRRPWGKVHPLAGKDGPWPARGGGDAGRRDRPGRQEQ